MFRRIKIVFVILLGVQTISLTLNAQTHAFSSIVPIKSHAADLFDQKFGAFAVSPFSGTSFNFYSPYALKDVFAKTELGEYRVNPGDLASHSAPFNTFFSEVNSTLLYFSGKNKKHNWSFRIEDEVFAGIKIQKDLLQLIHFGNAAFIGEQINITIPAHAIHYRSFNYSWAKKITKKLQLGYTAKIYFGKSFLKMNSNFTGLTSESMGEIAIGVKGSGKVSSPLIFDNILDGTSEKFNWMRYLFEFRNPGAGVDFSINYRINTLYELKAGIENVGFVLWTHNTTKFSADNNYNWQGIDLSGQINLTEMSDVRNNKTVNHFKESFLTGLFVSRESSFVSLIPSRVYGCLNYYAFSDFDFSAYLSGQLMNNTIRTHLMFVGSYTLLPEFKITSGFSMTYRSYFNIPLGVSLTSGNLMVSLNSSNIIGILAPAYSKNFGGHFSVKYRINASQNTTKNYKKINSKTPFYQPLKRPIVSGRIF